MRPSLSGLSVKYLGRSEYDRQYAKRKSKFNLTIKMSLSGINWRGEALEFAKKHNSNREMVLQLVELAMKHGAEIAIGEMSDMVHEVNSNLQKKRIASAPHKEIKRQIQIDQ